MTKKLFPGFLDAVMQKHGVNQVTLSRKTGIAVSRINNYLQAKYRTIKPAHIQAICEAVTDESGERAELVKIYLLDMMPEELKSFIEIKALNSPKDHESWFLQKNRLPKDFAGEFEALYKLCVSMQKVRTRTSEWIQIMREIAAS
jgi:DNA-binding Xre family transcriptional regulator